MAFILSFVLFYLEFHRLNYHRYELFYNWNSFVFEVLNTAYLGIFKYFYQLKLYIKEVIFYNSQYYTVYYICSIMLQDNLGYLDHN
jgi:hypothetical protein